jgi:hypothetical protein
MPCNLKLTTKVNAILVPLHFLAQITDHLFVRKGDIHFLEGTGLELGSQEELIEN